MKEQRPSSQHERSEQKQPNPAVDKTWKWNDIFSHNNKNNHQNHPHIQQRRRPIRRKNSNSNLNNPYLPPLIRFLSLSTPQHRNNFGSSFGLHHSPSESFAGILPCLVGDGDDDENDDVGGSGSGAAATLGKEDGKIAVITTTTEHPTRKPSCHFTLHHPPIGEILPFLTQASSSSIFKSSASKTTLSSTPKPQDTSGSENVAEDTIVEISNEERSSPFHQDKYIYNNDDDSQRSSTVLVSTSTETTEAIITSNSSIATLTDEREESKPVVVIVEEKKKVEKDCNIRGKSVSSTTAVGQQEMDEDDGEVIEVSPSISSDNKATTIPGLCNSVYDGIVVDAANAPADDHPHQFECINNMGGLDEYDECESTVGVVILEDGTVGVSPEEEDKEEEEDNGWEKSPDFTTIRHLEAQQQQTTQQHQHSNTHGGNENNKDDPWLVVIER